ncbi:hypothetical protein C8R44DRAFT_886994 [Mycena epipterygia]|nr:hypothetical protein C8R44DRAFT_886994 [Mycena epipterygia]
MLSLDRSASPTDIQLSPENTAITAGCSSQATFNSIQPPPASRSSITHVGADVYVISAKGSILHVVTPKATKVKAAVFTEGWVAYALWLNTGSWPIASFMTTWKVPAVPATNHGQTVFLFNSIEPNSGDAILQPYGPSAARGGAFWALATWVANPHVFSGINLKLRSGAMPTVARSKVSDTADGLIITVNTIGSAYVEITIAYEVEQRQLDLAAFFWYRSCNVI